MTTIIGIIIVYFFVDRSMNWAAIFTVIITLIQEGTTRLMKKQYRRNRDRGDSSPDASLRVSDTVTHINMVSTFTIWGLGIYAVVIKFF
jgi:hypothetical protein